MTNRLAVLAVALLVGCAPHPKSSSSTPAPAASGKVRGIALPGAPADGVFMDYLVYDRARKRVWVPAGNTGSGDVIDAANDQLTRIQAFPTADGDRHGTER